MSFPLSPYEAVPDHQWTPTSCVGAAVAYALRQAAVSVGRYMMDTQGALIRELGLAAHGTTLTAAQAWIVAHRAQLERFGMSGSRLARLRTPALTEWIAGRQGGRSAAITTDVARLYPRRRVSGNHAVAIAFNAGLGLVMVDPNDAQEVPPPRTLDAAREPFLFEALLIEWRQPGT